MATKKKASKAASKPRKPRAATLTTTETQPPDQESPSQRADINFRLISTIIAIGGFLILYFGLVESRVKGIVNGDEFVERVARRARPAMVFDAGGRILQDAGAADLLREPPVVEIPTGDGLTGEGLLVATIELRFKKYLPTEPIVEALDFGNTAVKVERGRAYDWFISIFSRSRSLSLDGINPRADLSPRFRVEVVRP